MMAIDGISSNHMRFFGMASGLDVDEIVKGFIQVERAPLDRLMQQKQILEWQQEDFRQINRSLRTLRDLAFPLQLQQTFLSRTATSSNPDAVSASASAGVALGSHTLTVHELAAGIHFHSGADITTHEDGPALGATLGEQFGVSGTITFSIISNGESHYFEFDADTHTIQGVAAAINGADIGLQAAYQSEIDRFFLASSDTGSDVTVSFEDTDGFLTNVLRLQTEVDGIDVDIAPGQTYAGQDARFDYNGAKNLTRSSNEFDIGGVAYTLHKADANPVTVAVQQDIDTAVDTIKEFVEQYNETLDLINGKLGERRHYDYHPLTNEQKADMSEAEIAQWEEVARSGLLRGDSLLSRLGSHMRMAMSGTIEADSDVTSLFSIGITTGTWEENGRLHIDEDRLRAALAEDSEAVEALFRQDGPGGSVGLARRLTAALDTGMEQITDRVGQTESAADRSAIGRRIGWLDDAIERSMRRLEQREAYFYRQFSVLESFISHMDTQSMWLMQAFGGMGGGM